VQPNTNFGSIARWASIELETFVPEDADYETIDGEKRYTGTTPPPGYFWQGKPFPAEKKKRLAIAQDCLDWTMEDWLFRFPSTIAMQRDAGVLEAKVAYSRGLLSALAMQLMQTAARRSVHLCSECREPFVRHGGSGGSATERKPRADRDEFCDACRERGAIGRRADARRREKKTRARQMYARGTDARTIAEKVGVRDPGTIELWAEKGNWNAKNAQAR
jgi:hypothetical protein